jgi:hypothetical protein
MKIKLPGKKFGEWGEELARLLLVLKWQLEQSSFDPSNLEIKNITFFVSGSDFGFSGGKISTVRVDGP